MGVRDHFDRIMSSLHDAMLDDTRWPAASRLIDETCEIRDNALVAGKGRSQADGEILLFELTARDGIRLDAVPEPITDEALASPRSARCRSSNASARMPPSWFTRPKSRRAASGRGPSPCRRR